MTDWKGPWRCEECGKIGSWTWAEMVRDLGHHYASDIVPECRGKVVPHDRRVPDPEKQALVAALEEIAAKENMTLLGESYDDMTARAHQIGAHKAFNQAAMIAKAALRRYEGGEG